MRFTKRTLATAAVVTAIGAGAAIPAIAQDASEPSESTTTESDSETTQDERKAAKTQAFADALAAELGLPSDQVADAVTKVREQMRAEHDAERGDFPFEGGRRGRHGHGGHGRDGSGPGADLDTDATPEADNTSA